MPVAGRYGIMIVVTGGAGFIGSNLVAGLEERGERDIVVCDRLGDDDKWRNIAKRELADVIAPDELLPFLQDHRAARPVIFHLGAISSTMERDADLFVRTNFALSLALWRWCAETGCRFIYASSAATYGDGAAGFDDDGGIAGLARLRPLNAYGWSKHLFDRRVARLLADSASAPPQWAGLKFFNVFGPNEYHKANQRSVVTTAYPGVAAGGPVRLMKSCDTRYPDGGQRRDFVWVGDCVSVMLWLLDQPEVTGLYNVGTGQARTFEALAKALLAALGRGPEIEYFEMPESLRGNYQYFTEAKMERLRAAGYERPFTSLEEAVKQYVERYLSRPDCYR